MNTHKLFLLIMSLCIPAASSIASENSRRENALVKGRANWKSLKQELKECASIGACVLAANFVGLSSVGQVATRSYPQRFIDSFAERTKLTDWWKNNVSASNSPKNIGALWGLSQFSMSSSLIRMAPILLAARAGSSHKLGVQDIKGPAALAFGLYVLCTCLEVSGAPGSEGFLCAGGHRHYNETGEISSIERRNYWLAALGLSGWIIFKRLRLQAAVDIIKKARESRRLEGAILEMKKTLDENKDKLEQKDIDNIEVVLAAAKKSI